MKFYQVNQNRTFDREFEGGYLCSPNGPYGGWPLMQELQRGDVLFHYRSSRGAVLGISHVLYIGKHKGASKTAHVIPGTQCIRYTGRHLSEADFSATARDHYRRNYSSYIEVHTAPVRKADLGKLLSASPQKYLVPIGEAEALRFLKKSGIVLDDPLVS